MRQLANVLRRALLALAGGEEVTLELLVRPANGTTAASPAGPLPATLPSPPTAPTLPPLPDLPAPPRRLASLSDEEVVEAMEQSGWRILGAARLLGVSRPSMYKLLAANRLVRAADAIADAEIRQALARHHGDLERCAAALKTPCEALRRRVGQLDAAAAQTPA